MSLLDETASDLPVKDIDCRPAVLRAIQDVIPTSNLPKTLIQTSHKMKGKDLKFRSRVSVISREELEDSFLRLHEENLLLKGYARKQEDRIKRMATKLLRLTSDLGRHGEKKSKKIVSRRDLEAEETMENLQERVRDLEHRNETLRQRLTTYKQRLQLQNGCRHCPYGAIAARIDSSMRKSTKLPEKCRKGLRMQGPDVDPPRVTTDCYGESLSDEARADTDRLFQIISRNCNMDEITAMLLKHIVVTKPKDPESEVILSLQHMQQAEDQRTIIQENVMNIRLQKELREKNLSLCTLKEQFQQLKESYEAELEEKQKALTLSHRAVLDQLENLNEQLKEERSKVVALESERQNMINLQRSLTEVFNKVWTIVSEQVYHIMYWLISRHIIVILELHQDQINDLEKEKQLLKENYENLLKSSLDSERLNSWKVREEELRAQISKLEQHLQHHEFDLTFSKEQLQHEREQSNQLGLDISKLQSQLLEKMQEIHNLQKKLSSTTYLLSCAREVPSKPEVNQMHIQEEGILRKMYCQKEGFWNRDEEGKRLMCAEESNPKLDIETRKNIEHVDVRMEVEDTGRTQLEQDTKRKMLELDAAHAETILELEKIQELLILQQKITKDYQEELKSVKLRAECETREKEERERHYEDRLLKRNARIQMLEAQLKDIAYGTLPYRPKAEDSSSPEADVTPPPSLQRGETLFEFHIGSICFSPHGIRVVDDPQPVTFCIYSFYDFETHATPVETGIHPEYNFTSRYAVTPNPEFLSYLRVGTLTVELYQVIGGEHCELARGRLRLEAALQNTDRHHSTILMTDALGENIAELDYWLRLHGPLSRAQCLQRQRSKAKVYVSTRKYNGPKKLWASQLNHENQNALNIKVWGCRSLKAATLGQQPSPYVVYRFYTHPDHSSSIIPCSNNPQFGDEAIYPVNLSSDLERYLQQQCLYVYVFDDEETQPASYLGKAEVPLHTLSLTNDDDDIIVAKPLLPHKSPSSRIRVEIASLTLDPCSEVVADESVERVFVEFQFAGVPPEETETPLSLRKPRQGEEIYYHFSKVIHLDGKEHSDRRHFLYMLLEGSDSNGERVRLKFTVVSEPVNEEEEDCHDIGYAYLDLRHLLRRSVDPVEETLQIMDALDPRQTIGSLRVMIEAREAAREVYKEKRTQSTRSTPSIILN
ncbi:X-linked retinitis pigmentosa GTPase regulator-interacting protein 1 [Gastrophryne carolinensis]